MDTSIDEAVLCGPEVELVGIIARFVHMVLPCSAGEEFGEGIVSVSILVEYIRIWGLKFLFKVGAERGSSTVADRAGRHDWCAVDKCSFVVLWVEEGVCEDPWVGNDLPENNDCNRRIFNIVNGMVVVLPAEGRGTVFVREGGHGWVNQGNESVHESVWCCFWMLS